MIAVLRGTMDPYRLPRQVVPTRYEIRLVPDLTTSVFAGVETITVTVHEPTSEILLNAAELEISEAAIEHEGGRVLDGLVQLDESTERGRVRFPETLRPGEWRLRLAFKGILNDKLRGFYRSTYREQTGAPRVLAATQFEATDARRAFPCWDEPAFKAVFSLTLVIDPGLTAVSNTRIVSERVEGGKKILRFADTIRMSTYLVAIIVGDLEATDAIQVGRTPLRVWCVPGKRHLAAFALEVAADSLRFFQDYYGLHSSRPIEYPVRAPHDADAMFDVLTYEKGASVLRMLEQYLGPDVFRAGVRDYLRAHAYDNADTGDLWAALQRTATQPVLDLMQGWIFRAGYPLINVDLDQDPARGSRLLIAQQRFTYLPSSSLGAADQENERDQRWHAPLLIRITARGQSRTHRILLTEPEARLDLPDGFESALVNEGGHGFYRVRYGPALLERLMRVMPGGLPAIERFNVVNDAWAAAVAGLMPLSDYLELTASLRADRDKNVWAILIDSFHALNRIIDPSDRPALEALVRHRIQPAVAELGWVTRPGESELIRQLRGDLLRALGTIGNDRAVQARAAELYADDGLERGERDSGTLDPNVLPALIAVLAHVGDAARYDEFLRRFRTAATPQEERRYLYALAAFQPPALLDQTLARAINGEIRTQDAPFVIRSLLMSVYGRERAWNFVKANWDTMDRMYPKSGLRRLCEGVIGLATPELERDVLAFFAERKIDFGGKTRDQYLEQLHVAVVWRERDRAVLRHYLTRFAAP